MTRLGKKRKHKWKAYAEFDLTEAEAQQATRASTTDPTVLGLHNLSGLAIGCEKCLRNFEEVHGQPCTEKPTVKVGRGLHVVGETPTDGVATGNDPYDA